MNLFTPVFNQDALLLELIEQGCKQSFKALYEKYWESTYIAACKRINNQDEAKDIVQDIFTHIWIKREVLHIKNLPAYLHVAVRNKISKIQHKQKLMHPLFNTLESMSAKNQRADSNLVCQELFKTYEILLNTLSPKKQIIFHLRFQKDLPTKDIAKQLGVSRKTIQNQLGSVTKQVRNVFLTA